MYQLASRSRRLRASAWSSPAGSSTAGVRAISTTSYPIPPFRKGESSESSTRRAASRNRRRARLRATASCDKGGFQVLDKGPGNDWRCVVTWHLPGATAVGTAIYQLDVTADGRYVADGDGPKEVNGYFQVRTPTGDAPNPLWQFDGNIDLLASSAKE